MFRKHFNKVEEDIHIKILRYALASKVFIVNDLCKDLNLNDDQKIFLLSQLDRKEFFERIGTATPLDGENNSYVYLSKYMLSFEGRSRLLEYDELKEARENAHRAQVYAIFALIVSAIGVIVQIFC